MVAVGAGVGASLGALSLAMLALFLNERRRRKNIERTAMGRPVENVDHYAAETKPSPQFTALPQELGDTGRPNELGPSYYN